MEFLFEILDAIFAFVFFGTLVGLPGPWSRD